ncbi:MAG TPA: tetratricopeptide repeat protein [Vicinamibacteria bacterium]|nr:tetratricopeptide repeat protein [Vicinamibacteria bacterium]
MAATPASPPKSLSTPPAPPTPPPSPTAGDLRAARVGGIVAAARAALAAGKLEDARTLFDDALALDPNDTAAKKGKALVTTTLLGQTRTFVPDLASSEGAEGRLKSMAGFDDVEERDVRRAAKVPGRAELDGTPAHIKPGESYKVEIYLRNLSTKKKSSIKLENVGVNRIVNEKATKVAVEWTPVEVQAKQRVLVATVTGAWEDDVSSWVLDVKMLSQGNDIYENRLVWK